MTLKGIELLKDNEKGFVILVESGRIDHAHHENLAHLAIDDFVEFDQTIESTLKQLDLKETLVIVTADHSHSMSFIGYDARNTSIFDNGLWTVKDPFNGGCGEFTKIQYATGPGASLDSKYNVPDEVTNESRNLFPANIQKSSGANHGAEDVPIYAQGPMAHLFHGTHEQSYIHTVATYAGCLGDFENEKHCLNSYFRPVRIRQNEN